MKLIEEGDAAPNFTAMGSNGKTVSLSDYRGKNVVVLFFYPKDGSPICTSEACAFRDSYEDFVKAGAVVIGVSNDSQASHREFAERNRLPFLMIADQDGTLKRLYSVTNALFVLPGRVTFVIDRDGIVRQKFRSELFGSQHATEALATVRKLTAAPAADAERKGAAENP